METTVQYRMMLQIYYLIRRSTRWFLRNRKPNMDIQKAINEFRPAVAEINKHLPQLLDGADKETFDIGVTYLLENKVPEKLPNAGGLQWIIHGA